MKKFGKNEITGDSNCDASIDIKSTSFYYYMLLDAGTTGLGETYMNGIWNEHKNDNYDLHAFMHYLVDNVVHTQQPLVLKFLKFLSPIEWWNYMSYLPKTIANDQIHIDVGYSFGNDFFNHLLDEKTLTYTCAIYKSSDAEGVSDISPFSSASDSDSPVFVNAQYNKYDTVFRKLKVDTGHMNILEIGSGWGAFADYLHTKTDANITALTIVQPQIDFSIKKYIMQNEGSNDHLLDFVYLDYRNIVEQYGKNSMDRVVSLEMIEHAGHKDQLLQFMKQTYDVLKPGGRMVLQLINRNNLYPEWKDFSRIEDCCTFVTFVDQYIFPGACIVMGDHVHSAADSVGFKLIHKESFGQQYVRTLQYWRAKLETKKSRKFIVAKYGLEKYRAYKFSIALGEASFRLGFYDVGHMVFLKPMAGNPYQSDFHYRSEILFNE